MNYQSLDAQLTGRCKDRRKLANNTWAVRGVGVIAIRLHQTDVVQYHENGDVVLTMGGYNTLTTRDRLNAYTPREYRVWTERGIPHVSVKGKAYRFFDGITFGPRGGCKNPMSTSAEDRAKAKDKATCAAIDQYIAGWIDAAVTGQMPLPSNGDCWHCAMFPETDHEGESHLAMHLEEGYHVPSLIVKACGAKGYPNMAVAVQYVCGLRPNDAGTHFDGTHVDVKMVRSLLRWYLRKHLRAANLVKPRLVRA